MFTTKREHLYFSFYDHAGIARHLEQMAQKGWMLQRIRTNGAWIYRRIEPQKIHFAVTYFPRASDFHAQPGDDQQEFLDLCAAAGWSFVAQTFQMQIFCNAAQDPVPLETDPAIQVENVHEAMWANYLPGNLIIGFLGVALLFLAASRLETSIIHALTSTHFLFLLAAALLLLFYEGGELLRYYLWHHKALRVSEEEGRFYSLRGGRLPNLLLAIAFSLLLLLYALVGGWKYAVYLLFSVAAVLLIYQAGYALRDWLKRRNTKTWVNRVLSFLFTFLLILGLQFSQDLIRDSEWMDDDNHISESYTHEEKTYTAYLDPLPLTAGDLMGVDDSLYSNRFYERSTFLASITSGSQYLRVDCFDPALPQSFYYHIYRSSSPLVLNSALVWAARYVEYTLFNDPLQSEERLTPAPFGAKDAWYRVSGTFDYLLRYEDVVLQLSFGWEPTTEQVETAIETLLGE